MTVSDAQVRNLMRQYQKHGKKELASLQSGMNRKTGRKYIESGKLPSQSKKSRRWRTRRDPFEERWSELESMLAVAPELNAKTLWEYLEEKYPGEFEEGQLRTLQRKVKKWRGSHGPEKEVFIEQEHVAGEAMQTDFTVLKGHKILIDGGVLEHKLCQVVLPFSNWQWVSVCRSESMAALKRGLQSALCELGHTPQWHQTDNSTAATHELGKGKRRFNKEYSELLSHFGIKPRTIKIGKSHQNGDVESLHHALKRRVVQYLALRGSNEFASVASYEDWLRGLCRRSNRTRGKRLAEELRVMRPLRVRALPEFKELKLKVTRYGTVRIQHNSYSVPSRLSGEEVRARVYEDRLEVYFQGRLELECERLLGRFGYKIDYRHLIHSLLRKPGAFARCRYREELFPTQTFKWAWECLSESLGERRGQMEYLRVLHLAAMTMESEVETALELCREQGEVPVWELTKQLVAPRERELPHIKILEVDLGSYDELLSCSVRGVV